MRIVVTAFLILLVAACNPHVELEDITAAKLLSISCVISPQNTVFTAYVFRASPLGSTVKYDSAAVKNALVTISDGQAFDTLTLTSEVDLRKNTIYKYKGKRKNVNVVAESKYYLEVSTTTGDHISANCTIPPTPGDPIVDGTKVNNDFNFTISWTDVKLDKYFILILDDGHR